MSIDLFSQFFGQAVNDQNNRLFRRKRNTKGKHARKKGPSRLKGHYCKPGKAGSKIAKKAKYGMITKQ